MSRKNKRTGLSIKDILAMDNIENLPEAQLRPIMKQLADTANRRITEMTRHNEKSPAYRAVIKSGGRFGVGGKSYSDLQKDASRAINFLKHKTSTMSGWNAVKEDIRGKLEAKKIELKPEQWDDFWDAYEKLSEMSPDVKLRDIMYEVYRGIHSTMTDNPELQPDEIAVKLSGEVSKIYEKRKQAEKQRIARGTSQFFEE